MFETPDAGQNIITRGLPKTGQVGFYYDEDDGHFQLGWWRGRKVVGNRTRFIAKTINGDNVLIDRAIGLMWADNGDATINNGGNSETWRNAFASLVDKEFAGFEDWRLPNILELISFINFGAASPAIYDDFTGFPDTGGYWSSTTCFGADTSALTVLIECGVIVLKIKTEAESFIAVRGGL